MSTLEMPFLFFFPAFLMQVTSHVKLRGGSAGLLHSAGGLGLRRSALPPFLRHCVVACFMWSSASSLQYGCRANCSPVHRAHPSCCHKRVRPLQLQRLLHPILGRFGCSPAIGVISEAAWVGVAGDESHRLAGLRSM